MLIYILYGLFILACIVLVVTVLLQPGKADAGALFSSSVSSTAFGPRGTQTILSKITIAAAAGFMLVALLLSMPAVTGKRSVVQSAEPVATPQASPGATTAPVTTTVTPTTQAETNSNTASANTNASANTSANANKQGKSANTAPSPATSPQTGKSPAKKK